MPRIPNAPTQRAPPLAYHPCCQCNCKKTGAVNVRSCYAPPSEHDAADAGGVAAVFDFGDAARMAAEFAPVLGGAPAGQRRHWAARARTRTRSHTHTRASAPACSHLLTCLLAFASMSRSFALLVPLTYFTYFCQCCALTPVLVNTPPASTMRSALALVLAVATVGSLALSAQPHRVQLARRVRLSRPGLGRVRMQDEEEIAELEARLAKLKKAKVRRVRVRVGARVSLPAGASA